MDGKAIQQRLVALKSEMAMIREAEAIYRQSASHTAAEKKHRNARHLALENIKAELAALSNRKIQ